MNQSVRKRVDVVVGASSIFKPWPNDRNMSTQHKALAKRSQHANATCRNIVGLNMLRAFGQPVATCCDLLGVVGSNLAIFKLEPTTPNTSQHGGQTHATCCAQQCCDMLCWHVAIVWPGLHSQKFVEFPQVYSKLPINHRQSSNRFIALDKPIKSTSRKNRAKRLRKIPDETRG